jgi:eukaryotic-like serine/threonine-protein kinase
MIGQLIAGRYELQELVGSGGMSSVYRARDGVLERPVAIKILHDHFADDPEYVERFRREARAIARLNHPNIVTVIDRGEFDGRQFIVFEHVPGETLKSLVERRGPLPVDEALALTHQVARGLAYAHEHGVVHRDVKPQNVLIDRDGRAKVMDFGIARSLTPGDELTETGTLLGTSEYIAPEQASGLPVDERSDQYSLGVMLYELLAGGPPYTGDSFMAVAMKHVQDPVPRVRDRRADVSPRLDAIVARAMAKRRQDRFSSTEAMMAALEAALADDAIAHASQNGATQVIERPPGRPAVRPAPRPAPRRRGGLPLPLVLALLAIGVAALVLALVVAGGGTTSLTGGGGGGASARVQLGALADYDPEGDSSEHPEAVARATDGNPTTYWTTETYRSFSKSGVGVVLDARRSVELSELRVTSDTPGFTAEIRASDSASGGFKSVSDEQTVEGSTTFGLSGGSYRYYLVWITDPNGRAHINEVRARS